MTGQYKIGRMDSVPGTARYTKWQPFWEAVIKAFTEEYVGWVTIEVPNHQVAQSACQSLYYRRRHLPDTESLDFCYRKQLDSTILVLARLSRVEDSS